MRDQVKPLEPYIERVDGGKLTRREALALRLAGSLGDQPYRLADALMEELRSEFSDAEIVEMIFACALFSWGNIIGIACHLDTTAESPYGSGLDYVEGKRRKQMHRDQPGGAPG